MTTTVQKRGSRLALMRNRKTPPMSIKQATQPTYDAYV
ncbi:hypothetical protein ALQ68_200031 [Pseudomonas savastanoi pv. glycinea]|nr:hypothetical protein ALQ68_200031 [Pseudomonas savastanoi pv. glycinea]